MAKASRVGTKRLERLHQCIVEVLSEAITAGGSTIRDFRQAGMEQLFSAQFLVYGREGEPCRTCGTTLKGKVIGGRASVYCPAIANPNWRILRRSALLRCFLLAYGRTRRRHALLLALRRFDFPDSDEN